MTLRPAEVWTDLQAGNRRFVAGESMQLWQGAEVRRRLASGQSPRVAIFGCSDSRVPVELIFDLGIGDAFVVRNAGQVLTPVVLGSLEFALGIQSVDLLVVLRHDACGAVRAAIDSQGPDSDPLPPHVATLIEPIVPIARRVAGLSPGEFADTASVDAAAVGRAHLHRTVSGLIASSEMIAAAVADGTLAIVGANYRLAEGQVIPEMTIGIA